MTRIRGEVTIVAPVEVVFDTVADRPHRLRNRIDSTYMSVDGTLLFTHSDGTTRLRWDWDMRLVGWMRLLSPVLGLVGPPWERRNWVELKHYLEGQQA